MYEVLDVKRMMKIKSPHVRNRKSIPRPAGDRSRNPPWKAVILVEAGISLEKLNHIPAGSEIKLCIQDKTLWEVFIAHDCEENIKKLAKRLDAIAFL